MPKKQYQPHPIHTFEDLTYDQRLVMQEAWESYVFHRKEILAAEGLARFEENSEYIYTNAPYIADLLRQGLLYFKRPASVSVDGKVLYFLHPEILPLEGKGLRLTEKGIALMQAWEDQGRPGEAEDEEN